MLNLDLRFQDPQIGLIYFLTSRSILDINLWVRFNFHLLIPELFTVFNSNLILIPIAYTYKCRLRR